MPSQPIVSGLISDHLLGTTTTTDPILFMEVDGVKVAGSYIVQTVGNSVRYVFPKKVGNSIYLMAMGQTFVNDLPAKTISVQVLVAE